MAACQLSGIQEPPLQLHHERDIGIFFHRRTKRRERERERENRDPETNKKPDQVEPHHSCII
jgi:hypothetical protein